MTRKQFWNSLSSQDQAAVNAAVEQTEARGYDVALIDAVDIWFMLPTEAKGRINRPAVTEGPP